MRHCTCLSPCNVTDISLTWWNHYAGHNCGWKHLCAFVTARIQKTKPVKSSFFFFFQMYQISLSLHCEEGATGISYLLILVGSDCDELRLWENISPEGAVRKLQYVVGSHNMKSGLVFVHGIQNGLEKPKHKHFYTYNFINGSNKQKIKIKNINRITTMLFTVIFNSINLTLIISIKIIKRSIAIHCIIKLLY